MYTVRPVRSVMGLNYKTRTSALTHSAITHSAITHSALTHIQEHIHSRHLPCKNKYTRRCHKQGSTSDGKRHSYRGILYSAHQFDRPPIEYVVFRLFFWTKLSGRDRTRNCQSDEI